MTAEFHPARGRLNGSGPVAVVDIGSNSVRLVIYERKARTPTMLFNEKLLAGLGKGIAATGRLADMEATPALLARVGLLAADCLARAVGRAVVEARSLGDYPDYRSAYADALSPI